MAVTGVVSGTSFTGNGANLSSITGANVVGEVANAAFATTSGSVDVANVTGIGNIATLNLNGNSATYLDGTGTWTEVPQPDATKIINGTTDVTIATAGGNVATTVGGTANVVVVSSGAMTLTGDFNITGNINATGNLNYQNVVDLVVGDPLIFIGANNAADTFDLGFDAQYSVAEVTTHTGFARDHTDGVWKLYDSLTTAPTTDIDFDAASFAKLKAGDIESTGNVVAVGAVVTTSITGPLGNLVTQIEMEDDSERIDFNILDDRKMRIDEDGVRVYGELDADTADFESMRVQTSASFNNAETITITGGSTGQVLAASGVDDKLEWVTLPSHSDSMKTIMVGVDFNGGTPYGVTIPAGTVVDNVSVIVDTAFDGGATVTVGSDSTADFYVAASDTLLSLADRFEIPQSHGAIGTDSQIVVAVTPNAATVGFVRVIVSYSTPRN
jgi:hypothetical protein